MTTANVYPEGRKFTALAYVLKLTIAHILNMIKVHFSLSLSLSIYIYIYLFTHGCLYTHFSLST